MENDNGKFSMVVVQFMFYLHIVIDLRVLNANISAVTTNKRIERIFGCPDQNDINWLISILY